MFPTLYANGECFTAANGVVNDCKPSYSYSKSIPPTNSGYNILYITPENGVFEQVGSNPNQCVFDSGSDMAAQCVVQGCQSCVQCGKTCVKVCGSPILVDLSGDGFFLTDYEDGVNFDISGGGKPGRISWTKRGAMNAFLALPGPDGLIHNGTQLFGNFMPQPPSDQRNGFAALAVYDDPKNGGNGDGIIDARDAIWTSLRLWIDKNHDGV